jgi:hypothetical protein
MRANIVVDLLKNARVKAEMKKKLGRWAYHDPKQTVLKIKHANEDNCGVSGNMKPKDDDADYFFFFMGFETAH